MSKYAAIFILALATSSCSDGPTAKEATDAAAANNADSATAAVKAEKKSIEEAADAAAKLIEEESRQEIEGYASEPPVNAEPQSN